MTTADALQRASDGFRAVVARIGDDQWDAPTPCAGWNVHDLVGHVAAGSEMAARLADGASRNEAIAVLGIDHLGGDPLAAVDQALGRQLVAFEQPDIAVHVFHHPAGDMPGAQVINFRIGDLLVHQWDLARAIGVDETLDPSIVQLVWDAIQPMLPMMSSVGVFGPGPSGAVGDDAPLQLRLLDAMGRRP
ncbi:MAG: TIGR03086 family metal-binding protein [Ilumatobacteraceae bacterium]|jgi:uncharacterized protein (TIGR03086 family)